MAAMSPPSQTQPDSAEEGTEARPAPIPDSDGGDMAVVSIPGLGSFPVPVTPQIKEKSEAAERARSAHDRFVQDTEDAFINSVAKNGWRLVEVMRRPFPDGSHADLYVFAANNAPCEHKRVLTGEVLETEKPKWEKAHQQFRAFEQMEARTDRELQERAQEINERVARETLGEYLCAQEGWRFTMLLGRRFLIFVRDIS